ncbi:membrane bound O-acyl transferase family-domain-containing protein [Colletotrichum navitas]|uniref:Membrane bound O-acyl transferase family-domain-containing protein n=1 Tax=Colletotrichum navitas TaxID=681940 RepID=A0AAD8QDL6_9PEZI|nr:membrane bound O-acyl transferase family-domain-containing protein [Colletotrichum navitas]KAK1600056.1 membrane bound O-acyl transferase family-domain-containing protein [Colletotrichum navitas]
MAADITATLGLPDLVKPVLSNITKPSIANVSSPVLATIVRDAYRAAFKARVAAGEARPYVFPYNMFASHILPILYMSIPHTKRPWLYRARWLVVAFIIIFDLDIMKYTSSTNMSVSYVVGVHSFFGIMIALTMLVFTAPQFDYERVARRKAKKPASSPKSSKPSSRSNSPNGSGLRKRAGSKKRRLARVTAPEVNLDEYEYYWQAYPEDGTFLERLSWVIDLYTNFRGVGWSWAVSSVPSPAPPERPGTGEMVKMDTIPLETFVGCQTYKDENEFLRRKLLSIGAAYVFLDIFKVTVMEDPYFVLGSSSLPLPPHLAVLPSWLVPVYRHAAVIGVIYAGMVMIFSIHDLFQYYFLSKVYPIRGELWQYATVFGSFSQILDRGLAGFWGSWWHQTFRQSFSAPVNFAIKQGYLKKGARSTKMVSLLVAFLLSGLLHAAGSVSSIPDTKWWKPALFFWLSGVGVVVQQSFCTTLKPQISRLPRVLRRLGNLLYVALWLHITVQPLTDDFAQTGLWLMEPVPVSLVRALGFGRGEVSWWKPDMESFLHWHTGKHWWDSGFRY